MALTFTDHGMSAIAAGMRDAEIGNFQIQRYFFEVDLLTTPMVADAVPSTPPASSGYVPQTMSFDGDGVDQTFGNRSVLSFGPATTAWPTVSHIGVWLSRNQHGHVRSAGLADPRTMYGINIPLAAPVTIGVNESHVTPAMGLAFDWSSGAAGQNVSLFQGSGIFTNQGRLPFLNLESFLMGGLLYTFNNHTRTRPLQSNPFLFVLLTKEPTFTDWGIPFDAFDGVAPSIALKTVLSGVNQIIGNDAAIFGPTNAAVTFTHYALISQNDPFTTPSARRLPTGIRGGSLLLNHALEMARLIAWDTLAAPFTVASGARFSIPANNFSIT